MARFQPYFPKSHGRERVDDGRVLSGIIFVNRNGLRWRDALREYGPAKRGQNKSSPTSYAKAERNVNDVIARICGIRSLWIAIDMRQF